MIRHSYIIGIDEVGRGPLAGPVAVGVVCVPVGFSMKFFRGIKDSKQLSEKAREEWFAKIRAESKKRKLKYKVSFASPQTIDKRGIVKAISQCIESCLRRLEVLPQRTLVLLDGSLKAPKEFKNQKTIIGGDESEPVISAGAIMAKVSRDRRMIRLAKKYPRYSFHIHKGYGTALHYKKIKKHGLSKIHRRSFINKSLGGWTSHV